MANDTLDGSRLGPAMNESTTEAGRGVAKRSAFSRRFAATMRWLHIYVSMLAFTIVLFFAVTGLTLNHADWFYGGHERRTATQGALGVRLLGGMSGAGHSVNKLEIVEHLRKSHDIRGALSDFSADDLQCVVVFKGPGYAADPFIDRQTGKYEITQSWHGLVAILNDLHKGRDTGTAWSWGINVSAILTAFLSLTGLIRLFYLKQRRMPGLILAVVGTVVVAVFRFWVP